MVVLHFHAQIADALNSGDFQPEIEICIEFKVVIRNDSFIGNNVHFQTKLLSHNYLVLVQLDVWHLYISTNFLNH